jgi:hypothetical protein
MIDEYLLRNKYPGFFVIFRTISKIAKESNVFKKIALFVVLIAWRVASVKNRYKKNISFLFVRYSIF